MQLDLQTHQSFSEASKMSSPYGYFKKAQPWAFYSFVCAFCNDHTTDWSRLLTFDSFQLSNAPPFSSYFLFLLCSIAFAFSFLREPCQKCHFFAWRYCTFWKTLDPSLPYWCLPFADRFGSWPSLGWLQVLSPQKFFRVCLCSCYLCWRWLVKHLPIFQAFRIGCLGSWICLFVMLCIHLTLAFFALHSSVFCQLSRRSIFPYLKRAAFTFAHIFWGLFGASYLALQHSWFDFCRMKKLQDPCWWFCCFFYLHFLHSLNFCHLWNSDLVEAIRQTHQWSLTYLSFAVYHLLHS